MKKRKKGKKFGRVTSQRKAMLKGLANSLILNGSIKTTEVKAKEIRPFVEKLITKAKKQDIHNLRTIRKYLSKEATMKLYKEISIQYNERKGGYARIIKLPKRVSDGAKMAKIELV